MAIGLCIYFELCMLSLSYFGDRGARSVVVPHPRIQIRFHPPSLRLPTMASNKLDVLMIGTGEYTTGELLRRTERGTGIPR